MVRLYGIDRNVPTSDSVSLEASPIVILAMKLNETVVGETFGAGADRKRKE